jgi:hypothetical protein
MGSLMIVTSVWTVKLKITGAPIQEVEVQSRNYAGAKALAEAQYGARNIISVRHSRDIKSEQPEESYGHSSHYEVSDELSTGILANISALIFAGIMVMTSVVSHSYPDMLLVYVLSLVAFFAILFLLFPSLLVGIIGISIVGIPVWFFVFGAGSWTDTPHRLQEQLSGIGAFDLNLQRVKKFASQFDSTHLIGGSYIGGALILIVTLLLLCVIPIAAMRLAIDFFCFVYRLLGFSRASRTQADSIIDDDHAASHKRNEKYELLKRIAELRDSGILTHEEFETEKEQILVSDRSKRSNSENDETHESYVSEEEYGDKGSDVTYNHLLGRILTSVFSGLGRVLKEFSKYSNLD